MTGRTIVYCSSIPTLLTNVRSPTSILVRDCLPTDSQRLPHIHGVCPRIQDRAVCVDFCAVGYVACMCFCVAEGADWSMCVWSDLNLSRQPPLL